MKYGPTFFPTTQDIEVFHAIAISQRGESGYVSKGLVKGALEWAMTDVYDFIPFPSLLLKAAALMYAYTCFHPYADGNKRTALMATSFFLDLNACSFDIPDNAPEFARELAVRTIDTMAHEPTVEISRVSHWLKENTKRTFMNRFDYAQRTKKALRRGLSGDIYISDELMSNPQRLIWAIEKAGEFGILPRRELVREFSAGFTTSTFRFGLTIEKEKE
ncbi:MAG: Fic family protein [Candidatus Bathyarchaeia archaeon]